MAEVDTYMLSSQHGDIRREAAAYAGDVRYNIASESCKTNDIVRTEGQENVMAVKDARHDVISATEAQADRLSAQTNTEADRIVDRISESRVETADRFFAIGRDLAGIAQGQATLAKDVELNALKTQLDAAKNTAFLSDKIAAEGEKTRGLINDLKYHDLNRGLLERNAELLSCEQDRRSYRDRWYDSQYQGQWAQLQSQVQAFQSQLQETRQGMVNFGTMAGVGQTSTSNNVR